MAAQWKHKRYFRAKDWAGGTDGADMRSTAVTFSSTSDATSKINFKSSYSTNSPTTSMALEDSGQTLVVTYEFSSESDQTGFKTAVDADYTGENFPWNPGESGRTVEHFKTEWLAQDGTTVGTTWTA